MKVFLALATLVLVAPVAFAAPLLNQVQNGTLESWSSPWSPDAWTVEIGNVTKSTTAAEGNFSAQLRAKPNALGGHYSILAQTIPQSGTDLPIVPGAFYDLSFDAMGIYSGKGVGRANVTWTGPNGVLRIDVIDIPETTTFASHTAHLQAPIDALTANAATSATLRFRVDGQSSDQGVNLWVDNVKFGLGSPV
ncbi:MAG TPA: hypothetical protein VM370_05610 [Candidatus Thermoplasmatota archaeon]|nr:hypothetical protein [Candidatus Thermoplasmatota archaeon]